MASTTATTTPVTPVITNASVTNVLPPAGSAAPWSVATITTSTVTNPSTGISANVENVIFELTPSGSSTYAGAIQADYLVGADGTLAPVDQIFYQPDGAFNATYYGSEALNPYFEATGTTPADPGYAYTSYSYAAGGSLTQVVAVEANGKSFIGTAGSIT